MVVREDVAPRDRARCVLYPRGDTQVGGVAQKVVSPVGKVRTKHGGRREGPVSKVITRLWLPEWKLKSAWARILSEKGYPGCQRD